MKRDRLAFALAALDDIGVTRTELGAGRWQSGMTVPGGATCLICGRGPILHTSMWEHAPMVIVEWSLRIWPADGATLIVRRGTLDAIAGWLEAWIGRYS